MVRHVRDFDWSTTPLGALDTWSERRKGQVETMLAIVTPAGISWGPDHLWMHNDAFGASSEMLPDATEMAPRLVRALQGELVSYEAVGSLSLAFAPLRDESSEVVGVLVTAASSDLSAPSRHDLRSPLAAILLWVKALETGAVPTSEALAAIAESVHMLDSALDSTSR